MRLVATLLTLIALAIAGWAGKSLYAVLKSPLPDPQIAVVQAAARQALPMQPNARQWPALFGEPQPPVPEPEPQPPTPEPQPPAPPRPPLSSLGYQLNGVVRANDAVWAIVSHPTGERLMRVGDALEDGLIITKIDEAGMWVSTNGSPADLMEMAK